MLNLLKAMMLSVLLLCVCGGAVCEDVLPWKVQAAEGIKAWKGGRTDEAEKTLLAAIKGAGKDQVNADLAIPHYVLSRIYAGRNKQSESKQHLQRAREILEKVTVHDRDVRVLNSLFEMADWFYQRARCVETEQAQLLGLEITEKISGSESAQVLQVLHSLTHLYWQWGHLKEMKTFCERSLSISEKLRNPGFIVDALDSVANWRRMQTRYKEEYAAVERRLRLFEAMGDQYSANIPLCRAHLGAAARDCGRYAEADELFQKAMESGAFDADSLPKSYVLNEYAILRRCQGRFQEAEDLCKHAVSVSKTVCKDQLSAVTLNDVDSLAEVYRVQGRYDEAEPLFRQGAAGMETLRGQEDFLTARIIFHLGSLCYAKGNYKESEPLLKRALTAQEKTFGTENLEVAATLNALGQLCGTQRRYEEAVRYYEKALAVREILLEDEHLDVAATASALADLYAEQRLSKKAETLYRKALAIDEKLLGPEHAGVANDLNNLATVCTQQKRYDVAEPLYRRALSIDEKVHGADSPMVIHDLDNLIALDQQLGHLEEVERLTQRANHLYQNVASEESTAKASPAPAPKPSPESAASTEPVAKAPTQEGPPPSMEAYHAAQHRGLGYLEEARRAAATDFDTKRRSYTDAEHAFKEALGMLERLRGAGQKPDPSLNLDEEAAQLRCFLYECHKCKPMEIK